MYCIHCTTQQQTSYTVYLLYSLHHTTTDKSHCIFTVFPAPHNDRQVTIYIYCIHCTTQQPTSYTLYLLYSLHHTTTDKLHSIFAVFTAPHSNRQLHCIACKKTPKLRTYYKKYCKTLSTVIKEGKNSHMTEKV